jgi:hypothetical protein
LFCQPQIVVFNLALCGSMRWLESSHHAPRDEQAGLPWIRAGSFIGA